MEWSEGRRGWWFKYKIHISYNEVCLAKMSLDMTFDDLIRYHIGLRRTYVNLAVF